jgi:acyl dehydratase
MTVTRIADVEFGAELPVFAPDTTLANVRRFAVAAGWNAPRFTDHEAARKEGLPGALVPGIMSQGFLAAMIHRWAPDAVIENVDTVFRAPVVVDESYRIRGVVTDVDEDTGNVEIDLTVVNEAGETRVFGTARVRLPL